MFPVEAFASPAIIFKSVDFPCPLSVHAGVSNALSSMMRHAASNDCLPTALTINRNNCTDELFKALCLACKNNNLGWLPSLALTTGKQFLDTIATVLVYLDPHRAHFIAHGSPLRHILGVDAIYNDPSQHGHAAAEDTVNSWQA